MSSKLERVLSIVYEINLGNYPTVNELCEKFEIKERTLFEDIKFIKERLLLDVIYDRSRNGYFNANPSKKLPEFDLSENEFNALSLSKDMLLEHFGAVFRVPLEQALKKIASRLLDKDISTSAKNRSIRFLPGGVARAESKILEDLHQACSQHYSVEIEYFSAYSGKSSTRNIDPYRILEHRGAWYTIGWCHQRKDVVMFALHRIRKHKVLTCKFVVKDNFDADSWISAAFMLEHGDGEHIVRVKFTPFAARYVLERQWHASQRIYMHNDGSCTLEFKAQNLDEIKRWVLPFGSGAEVIDPPELRKRVMDELRLTLRKYEDSTH